MPSPLLPIFSSTQSGAYALFDGNLTSANLSDHTITPLHADDSQPARIYSLDGSIIDGVEGASGLYVDIATIAVDKPAP